MSGILGRAVVYVAYLLKEKAAFELALEVQMKVGNVEIWGKAILGRAFQGGGPMRTKAGCLEL